MKDSRQDEANQTILVSAGEDDDLSRPAAWVGGRVWFGLPPSAGSRIGVLFGALVLIKVVLLIGLHRHLLETHWRVGGQPKSWLNHLAFYGVMVIGVCSLIELGRCCQAVGIRTVRRVNAAIIGLGLLFILLTFHEADRNYLYPILTGVLEWTSLGPYLSLDFFFRPPFLAAWLLGYAASYFVIVKLGHEKWVLGLTSLFAGSYWILCLREIAERREDLWVALVFGLVAMVLLRHSERRLHPAWWLLPAGWTLLVWGLFRSALREVGNLPPYFVMLTGLLAVLFVGASWLAKREGIFQPWIKVVAFYFLTFLLLANANYPRAGNFNNLLGFSAKFAHYFLGELCVVGLVAILAGLYSRLRPGGGLWWLDAAGLGLIVLALVDLRLTQVMGVRLGWDVIEFGNSPTMMWRMVKPYLAGLAVAVLVVSLVYAVAVRGASYALRRRSQRDNLDCSSVGGWSLAGCFALLAVLGLAITKPDNGEGQSVLRLVQTSPLGRMVAGEVMGMDEFHRTAAELGMAGLGNGSGLRPARERRNLNVLLILQESSYNKHCSLFSGLEETQPLLARYKDRMEIFPNFFSNFESSIHARFATFTGVYPIRDFSAFTLNRVGVKSIFEVMHDNGYVCSMFYSSFFDYTGFRNLLQNRGLDEMYDADTMPGDRKTERVSWGLREEETLAAIRQQIRRYATSPQPFFLTYVPAAPHYPYDKIPEVFRKYKPGPLGDYTSFYLNELLYMDWIIASILDELQETGLLDQTLVVITSDHGEMLGGNGDPVGHGWRLTPELANVPLILMDPSRQHYQVNQTIGSHVDLLPTLLDCLGIPQPPDELYQGRSLHSPPANDQDERFVYLNSYEDYAVIQGEILWKGDRRSETGRGGDRSITAYQISNNGQRTRFTVTTNALDPLVSIHRFDRFQESLLWNYSFYRDSLRKYTATNFTRASK